MAVETLTQKSPAKSCDQSPPSECPLCLETLDLDDRSFYPCTCGYQICRFCWHRILSESSHEQKGSCPACRKAYTENPANFKPLSVEDVQLKLKQQRKQKDQQKKKTLDSRKHLADLRVVQKNLVFVVGITPRIADPELLKKGEYFGKFGRIHKIVVNCVGQSTSTPSTLSYGAYITYTRSEDALRAIQSVNNVPFDGKTIKASLGTTKYCSHFMKNQQCPKGDCMYLHANGDPEASFTKEDMQQGKHQEYERRLIEEFNKEHGSGEREVVVTTDDVQEIIKVQEEVQEEVQEPSSSSSEPSQEPQEPPEEEEEPLIEPSIDFDPFYETQKAFESIIQAEMNQSCLKQTPPPPPGFLHHNNNNMMKNGGMGPTGWSQEDWIDPAIIYSSQQHQQQQQSQRTHQQINHLLGNSLLNDIFCGGSGGQINGHNGHNGQNQREREDRYFTQSLYFPPSQQQQQQQQQHVPQQQPKLFTQPPPGFQQPQQPHPHPHHQFINNNFFNNFPF